MFKNISYENKYRLYVSILALAGTVLILLTTSKYGAGVSSDAVRNLSTADNLLAGRGFVDLTGGPFILWPPLYPLLLAFLSLVSRWTVFQAAWYLNVFVYALNLWLSGWFLHLAFQNKPVYAVLGALIILLSRSTLRLYANVSSEPLFVSLMLLFFLAAAKYLDNRSPSAVWLMFALAGLATLQRYLGVVLIGVGGVIVLTQEGLRGLWRYVPAGMTAIFPIGAWVYFHNYLVSGTLVGPRDLGAMVPLENMSLALTKMLWWFIPRVGFLDPIILNPGIPLGILALVLICINRKTDWMNLLRGLSNPLLWPGIFFSATYFLVVSYTVVTADHLDLTSDRYYVILLPFVLALLFLALDHLAISHLNLKNRIIYYGLIALAGLWFFYPLYSLRQYVRLAMKQGEPTNYNIANSAQFREMSVVKAAQQIIQADPSAVLYTNYVNIVWFIYQRPVQELPFVDPALSRELQITGLEKYYPLWPGNQPGYIIWFIPNQYHNIAAPDELMAIASLKLLYQDRSGQIYYVQQLR
jgi:hypothetical protein